METRKWLFSSQTSVSIALQNAPAEAFFMGRQSISSQDTQTREEPQEMRLVLDKISERLGH